ncbi:shikimate kinase [Altererythrobacter sp. MF3-039]|uniref:shikimate kinase n=1 Tax=Altererythrobacter sp. MF3-039 TaxID=3252901 RepID=UPI00390C4EC8
MTLAPANLDDAQIAAIARRIDRPVVLVGLMGVGKSTVGRKLAALMGRDFVDADDSIEEAAQLSVAEIFEQFGEAYFRDGERRVIARLVEERHGVIATGGGAFCSDETRQLILDDAIAVWLDADIDTLVERTARKDNRPLLKNGNPREILTNLKDQRGQYYSQAQVHVVTGDAPHAETAMRILEAIDRWL